MMVLNFRGGIMTIASMVFVGNDVKVQVEGDVELKQHFLEEVRGDKDAIIFDKGDEQYKEIYDWCVENCKCKMKRKNRELLFVFE